MNERHTEGATAGESGDATRLLVGRYAPRVLTAIVDAGLFLFVVVIAEWGAWHDFRLTAETVVLLLLGGVPSLGIAYGGYWIRRSNLSVARYPRIGAWCFAGLFGLLAANLLVMVNFPAETLQANFGWARGVAVFGAVGGLVLGIVEARAIERARIAERAAVRAEHVEAQHNLLVYLNGVLRHEVLNTANVVEGYADLLIEEHDGTTRDRLERIRRQSRNMTEVIQDVRVLLEATEEADEFDVVDLGDVLTDAVTDLCTAYEGVEVDLSVPGDASVVGDDLLPRVFSNLLTNAVEHNDSDVPRVSVTAETTPDSVTVCVADNGPGVPEDERSTLFQRTSRGTDHGLGLYLVHTLARRYGGAAELRETGPDGSVFAVELPRATDASAEEPERSSPTRTGVDAFHPPIESKSA